MDVQALALLAETGQLRPDPADATYALASPDTCRARRRPPLDLEPRRNWITHQLCDTILLNAS
jgi:hypothetical protein